jgi:hypothetical protein
MARTPLVTATPDHSTIVHYAKFIQSEENRKKNPLCNINLHEREKAKSEEKISFYSTIILILRSFRLPAALCRFLKPFLLSA